VPFSSYRVYIAGKDGAAPMAARNVQHEYDCFPGDLRRWSEREHLNASFQAVEDGFILKIASSLSGDEIDARLGDFLRELNLRTVLNRPERPVWVMNRA
jgi:hypothetical protein